MSCNGTRRLSDSHFLLAPGSEPYPKEGPSVGVEKSSDASPRRMSSSMITRKIVLRVEVRFP